MSGISHAVRDARAAAVTELSLDHSQAEIAKILGVSRKTVRDYQRTLGITPAGRPEKGIRNIKTLPYEIKTQRQRDLAKSAARRMTDGISEINGLCRGMKELDIGMVVAGLEPDEAIVWVRKAKELSIFLNVFHKHLKEVSGNA